nr:immunoglobulin light chain junction region [Macaca mulatta]MOX28632.1 immunoglobulin light chain junction region [Macaca mulatta]MOX28767.1 immunoglobulin light chain junction region [Macaca mulatta]MOX29089.1 immunoglobulin light chain junction region [Macaca mulatta]MOX29105.1 immunoglobulin light chain junction region [Macaca mulatta]
DYYCSIWHSSAYLF